VQPYTHRPSGVVVVFNREIYNNPEMREELIAGGVTLTERSEVEMICELYLSHGVECLQKLNGMWAIALYDSRKRLLFLSRDRLGMKPLYYGFYRQHLIFGSEIKCILAAPDFPRDIDHQLMKASIYAGFINEPLTPFVHVRALLPGQYAVVADHDLETFKTHTYWSLPHVTDAPTSEKKSVDTLEQKLGELLEDSVRLRLRSDVPVAAFLSGGIDSAAILHYIKQIMKTHITAHSINFKRVNSEFDELTFQHEVTHHLSIENRRYYFEDRLEEIRESLGNGMWMAEFPDIGFEQDILFMHLDNLVMGDGYKVALSGEGADELLRGYEHYLYFPHSLRYAEGQDFDEFDGMADLELDDDELEEFAECEADFLREFGYPAALLGGGAVMVAPVGEAAVQKARQADPQEQGSLSEQLRLDPFLRRLRGPRESLPTGDGHPPSTPQLHPEDHGPILHGRLPGGALPVHGPPALRVVLQPRSHSARKPQAREVPAQGPHEGQATAVGGAAGETGIWGDLSHVHHGRAPGAARPAALQKGADMERPVNSGHDSGGA